MRNNPTVLSLFSGAGHADLCFQSAGFRTVAFCEKDRIPKATLKQNFGENIDLYDDILTFPAGNFKGKIDVITGGPPCQSYSITMASKRKGLGDKRGRLFLKYIETVKIIQPNLFVIENVSGLLNANKGKDWLEIRKKLSTLGYKIYYRLDDAVHFGSPSYRKRIFIIGVHPDINANFEFPIHTHSKNPQKTLFTQLKALNTVRSALEELPPEIPEIYQNRTRVSGFFNGTLPVGLLPNHDQCTPLNPQTHLLRSFFNSDGTVDVEKVKDILPTRWKNLKGRRRRGSLDSPSGTVDTGIGSDLYTAGRLHPTQWRRFTCRERARLMGIPDNFIYCGTTVEVDRQIGNGWSFHHGYAIAKEIYNFLAELDCNNTVLSQIKTTPADLRS